MSLFAEYIKQREGIETYEIADIGFVTYTISGTELYLRDIYVREEHRSKGYAWEFLEYCIGVAQENNCTHIATTVIPSAAKSTESLKVILAGGFQLHSSQENKIVFVMELMNGKSVQQSAIGT